MIAFIFETNHTNALVPAPRILDAPAAAWAADAAAQAGAAQTYTFGRPLAQALTLPGENAPAFPETGQALLLEAPMPLLKPETIRKCLARHEEAGNACTAMSGVYVFQAPELSAAIRRLPPQAAGDAEELIQRILSLLTAEGRRVERLEDADAEQFLVVDSHARLARAVAVMRERVNLAHMENGVAIMDPAATYIGKSVTIGAGTVIYPGVFLEGDTSVGAGCVIGPNTRLVNATLGDGVTAEFSVVLNSNLGDETHVGPFAYVRPNSVIGRRCKIGDFVEVKNSVIADGTKASHLTYIGDSDVGAGVNFGCGTVTVNYDGATKARTVIGDGVFIGCNANLIAPVTLEAGAYVAAGSTVTENVPPEALAIARARQVNKTNWTRGAKKKPSE